MMAKYRNVSLKEIQLGPILQEITEISIRHDIRLPASLALTGKALAQMQLATAMVAQRYRVQVVPGHPVEYGRMVALRPAHGIRVTLQPRRG